MITAKTSLISEIRHALCVKLLGWAFDLYPYDDIIKENFAYFIMENFNDKS